MVKNTRNAEIYHYGVKGMKWGIRRARKQLSKATTDSDRDKAISKLNSHRVKADKEIKKLDNKRPKLQKAYDRAVTKTDVKIAKLEQKSAATARKATRLFTSKEKAQRLILESQMLDMKIKELRSYSNTAKANLIKNNRMREMFEEGINDIDTTLIEYGRKYVHG